MTIDTILEQTLSGIGYGIAKIGFDRIKELYLKYKDNEKN